MWLKPRTAQNIVIGGAAGRLPAADRLGRGDRRGQRAAAAAVRDHLPVDAAAFLGAVAVRPLRLCRRRTCRCCRSSPGHEATRRQIFLYSLPMAAAAVAPWPLGLAGPIYGVVAVGPERRRSSCWPLPVLANRATEPAGMEPGKAAVRLFGALSVRSVRGAGRRPVARRMTEHEDEVVRKRQRERARLMALAARRFRRAAVPHHHRQDRGRTGDRARPAQRAARR